MTAASIGRWVPGALPPGVEDALGRLARTGDVLRIAVMPDVHLAEEVCVGVAVATRRRLLPQAVGSDIGCGMAAVRFRGEAAALADGRRAARILRELSGRIPAVRRRQRSLPAELHDAPLSAPALERLRDRDGAVEFGTLGRGNHFLELQADDEGALWLMLHSGSRAMGPAILRHHAASARRDPSGLLFLDADSDAGRAYLGDQAWALRYAEASRESMLDEAASVIAQELGFTAVPESRIRCLHNHLRSEPGEGEPVWVHRKGAISAREDEPGIIPGSMGTFSYHVAGRGCPEALRTSSHGAGRRFSRAEARMRIGRRDFERQMRGVWFDLRQTERLRDEAPEAYKDIESVMRAQRELTRIVRRLRPLLSYKGA
jgi:tRNA-splicing ligase RtcB